MEQQPSPNYFQWFEAIRITHLKRYPTNSMLFYQAIAECYNEVLQYFKKYWKEFKVTQF